MLDRLEKFMYDLVECGFGVPLFIILLPLYSFLKLICPFFCDKNQNDKIKKDKE